MSPDHHARLGVAVPTSEHDMPSLRDLKLFIHAGRMVAAAQQIRRGRAVAQVLGTMCRRRGLPSSVGASEGHRAVARAASRLARLGFADTCLVRSLALAALLADRDDVQVRFGFRPTGSPEALLSGHAWVTLGDRAVPDDSVILVDGLPCEEVAALVASRSIAGRHDLERL